MILENALQLNAYGVALTVFALLIVSAAYSRLRKPFDYRNVSSYVPSATKSLWEEITVSLSIAMKQSKELLPFFTELIEKYGPVVHLNIAGRSCVVLNDPDDIKIVLSSTQHITKGPEYDILKPWLNEGLLLTTGSKWQVRRKLFTSTFHFKTLHMYTPTMNKNSQIFVEKLMEASVSDEELPIKEKVTLCTMDIICESLMGVKINAQKGESTQYVNSIETACKVMIDRVFKFWLWNDMLFRISGCGRMFFKAVDVLHNFTDNVIKNKRASLKNSEDQNSERKSLKKSFLDLLISISDEFPDQITDKDIQEEVDTFFFEGHDTSSLSITITLLLLGIYPDVQDKVRDELRDIFDDDSERDATLEDLNEMKYLDAVIKESLRLYPSVPSISRELQTTLQIKNYKLPAMTSIIILPYILHRNDEVFPNPEEFVPERFLDEENKSKFLFGYIPFSAGPRNCIGQKYAMYEMKIVISTVLRKMKIETFGSVKDIKVNMELITKIESIPKVKFYKL